MSNYIVYYLQINTDMDKSSTIALLLVSRPMRTLLMGQLDEWFVRESY